MTISASGIRAGKAYVELLLKNAPFLAGLTKTQTKVLSLESAVQKVGSAMKAIAVGVGVKKAIGNFIDMGDELIDMSQKTGISVESLSQFKHAAELSSATLGDFETAIKKSNSALADAKNGNKAAVQSFKNIGLSVAELLAMSPEQRILAIGDAISRIEDSSLRSAAAVDIFGKSGTTLLPMFAEGAEGVRKAMAEAQIVTTEQAKAAAALGDEMDKLGLSFKNASFQAVSAFGPALERIAHHTSEVVAGVGRAITDLQGIDSLASRRVPGGNLINAAADEFRRTGKKPDLTVDKMRARQQAISAEIREEQKALDGIIVRLNEIGNMTGFEATFGGVQELDRLNRQLEVMQQRIAHLNQEWAALNRMAAERGAKDVDSQFRNAVLGFSPGNFIQKPADAIAAGVGQATSAIEDALRATQRWGGAMGDVVDKVMRANQLIEDLDSLEGSLRFQARSFGMSAAEADLLRAKDLGATADQLAGPQQAAEQLAAMHAEFDRRMVEITGAVRDMPDRIAESMELGSQAAAEAILRSQFGGGQGDLERKQVNLLEESNRIAREVRDQFARTPPLKIAGSK